MQISVRSQFGKHVPRILRRQLILQLMQQYLNLDHSEDTLCNNECKPTIQRFHGALLFVDISGFTALSLQLSPEDLKFHINEYFTKMLDIVDKHGGDVIKFAGDALFIIWETSQMMKLPEEKSDDEDKSDSSLDFLAASKKAVTTAVNCGLEINERCSNHKVSLQPRNGHRGSVSESSGSTSPNSTPTNRSSSNSFSFEKAYACLNVHSGVTVGLMAGVDIGCNDRWEYFLMGEPLTSVAMAEAQASTGEIVICPEAHALLHPAARANFHRAMAKLRICNALANKHPKRLDAPVVSKFQKLTELKQFKEHFNESAIAMPCGCLKGSNGYCKVRKSCGTPMNRTKRNKIKTKLAEGVLFDETNNEIESVFVETIGKRMSEMTSVDEIQNEFIRHVSNAVALNISHVPCDIAAAVKAAKNVKTLAERVKTEFMKWAHSCLIDDIARHVHDVVRSNYNFEDTSRIDVCRREIKKQLQSLNADAAVQKAKEKFHAAMMKNRMEKSQASLEKTVGILEGTRNFLKRTLSYGKLFSNGMAVSGKSERNNVLHQESAGSTGEIRSVTVMFINIDMPHMDLLVERPTSAENFGQFGFLSTTVNEGLADVLLLHRLQACMEALNDAFMTHGGQMRQFIVDDKGTVCIGTFGLRGAVSNDNAASTIETAHMIVGKLQALGLNCSIGVTLGKAFCGLVGSSNRHEYAVMGPSTNLSARLMCKAPPGGIICDLEIRNHDRTHQYDTLADIVAKGYKLPVSTFKPVFKEEEQGHWTKLKMSREFSHMTDFGSLEDLPEGESVEIVIKDPRRHSSLLSPDETLPMVIQKLIKGPYYGSVTNSDGGTSKQELIGRKSEVKDVLKFLFTDLLDANTNTFKVDRPVRFTGILGARGLGKSSVMHAVVHQVSGLVVSVKTAKIHIFRTRLSSFQAAVPFNAWKSVIKEMLIRMFNAYRMKDKEKMNTPTSSTTRRSITASMSVDVVSCVSYVMSLLPERMRKFEPLLGFLSIIPEQQEELKALKLSNQDIVMRSMELLFEIIQAYVASTKHLVFVVVEDLHKFDLASEMLLKHIWSCGVGMVVLFSAEHSMHQTPLRSTGTATTVTNVNAAVVAAAAINSRFTDLVQTDFARTLFNNDRFYTFELPLFTKAQTFELVRETTSACGVACVDANVMNRIFDESGGNPMYAYELAKSVAQMHKEQIDLSRVSVKLQNCHRLEEIICHRFDQLSTSAQALLKIAAAMCCFGSSFTFGMLMYVMVDSDRNNLEMQVVKDLLDIVNSESFLTAHRPGDSHKHHHLQRNLSHASHISHHSSHHDDDDEDIHEHIITAEQIASNQYHFDFNIKLERQTVYELLLGDQKQLIHERIAEYFQEQRHFFPEKTEFFHEESLHWQRASNWIHAMACSYYASKTAKTSKQANEHIQGAYAMYQAMRDNRNPFDSTKIVDWSATDMEILFEMADSNSEELFADTQHCQLGIDTVSHMFDCDPELLKISLEVEILMARKRLKKVEHLRENQKHIEEVIQMLLLTKNARILNTSRVTQLMRLLKHKTNQAVYEPCERPSEALYFTVGTEYLPLCLKMLSVLVENYLQFSNEHDLHDLYDKVQFALDEFDLLIRTTNEDFHQVHSWSLDLRLQCKEGNFKQACTLGHKILEVYEMEKHSADLIRFYGHDSTAASLAMISQYLLLSSEWRTPHKFLQLAHQTLERLIHVESIRSAVYFVTNSLVFLKRFDEALDLFSHYLQCVGNEHEERTMNDGIVLEWLCRLARFDKFSKSGDRELLTHDALVLDETILGGGLEHLKESVHDNLSVQGRGIDAVLAEVCALKIIVLWNNQDLSSSDSKLEDLRLYHQALSGYVKSTLSMRSGRPHELMFNRTNVVLSVLHLLQNIPKDKSPEKESLLVEDLITGDIDFPELKTSDLWSELRDIVDEELMQCVVADAHPQYAVFSLLAVSLLRKAMTTEDSPPSSSPISRAMTAKNSRAASRLGLPLSPIRRGGSPGASSHELLDLNGYTPFSDTNRSGGAGGGRFGGVGGVGGLIVAESVVGGRDVRDVNREVRGNVHQLMLNGSCTQKMKVLESYKVLGLAASLALR